jgi:hypothetical protein
MTCNNYSNEEYPAYGTRHFYKNIFRDYLADVGDGPHNADNLLLGLLDAAHEWFEYHETVSNRFKGFITKAQEIIKD